MMSCEGGEEGKYFPSFLFVPFAVFARLLPHAACTVTMLLGSPTMSPFLGIT